MVAQPLTGATVGPSPTRVPDNEGRFLVLLSSWSVPQWSPPLRLNGCSSLYGMRSVEPRALPFGQLVEPEGQFGPGRLTPSVMPAGQSLGTCPQGSRQLRFAEMDLRG